MDELKQQHEETLNAATETNKKRSSGSRRPSKKARMEMKRQQEEAATAAAQNEAEVRQHEINLARARRPDVLVKDCTINLICRDSDDFKTTIIKAASSEKE